jgi:DNA-binding IclR family transcriptional regulator
MFTMRTLCSRCEQAHLADVRVIQFRWCIHSCQTSHGRDGDATVRSRADLTQSVLKALDILECLAEADRPLSTREVAQRSGIPRPTAHRLITTLLARDYVTTSSDDGHYQFGAKLLSLGNRFLDRLDLPELAKEDLRALSQISGETVHLGVLDGTEVLYIGKVDGPQSVRMHSTIGARSPLYSTAMGKILLAFLPVEQRTTLLDQIAFVPYTSNTILDRETFIEHLTLVRIQGFALDDVENEEGIRCIGAPVFDHAGYVKASISISGPAFRLSRSRLEELSQPATHAGMAISKKLGYLPGTLHV